MWETALAFAIWGAYGSVLTAAHIDPALTAIARSAGLVDEMLYTVSAVATLFSLFILKDAPATPALLAGVAVVLGAIAASARIRE